MATTHWSEAELKATVQAYLEMLADEQAGLPINKAEVRRSLVEGPLAARGEGAVEYRMQNISSVLSDMRRPWIEGYKPADNVGPTNRMRIETLIREYDQPSEAAPPIDSAGSVPEAAPLLTARDIAGNAAAVMGIKAVWGGVSSSGICFGARGGDIHSDIYYSVAASVARRAVEQPFLITVSAGSGAPEAIKHRAINLVQVGTVYGPTSVILGESEGQRLAQWPVALLAHRVFRFRGTPHFVQDLGFSDVRFMSGLMDGVIRPRDMDRIWSALADWPVEAVDIPLPANIFDTGEPKVIRSSRLRMPLTLSKEEGGKLWEEQLITERDPKLAAEAKRLNLEKHGIYTCEACEFANGDKALFDAHHPTPLALGRRFTQPWHLEILCPICHRRAHRKGHRLMPFTLLELRAWIADGRPHDRPRPAL